MERNGNEWVDALSEQDIPADVVDWANIVAPEAEEEVGESGLLDAGDTIGEPPVPEE
ncbi:hypothetical protein ['Paenibacillus yunnanensis' Narsing Rao et al. 2020]|uniref:hypothetical protein n=1 Tax=Paenibacillus tengchongensis TaxID=2608684 RepID=UPI0016527D32|nr:hypothetical protein [Paenibacillus tengchongensis]